VANLLLLQVGLFLRETLVQNIAVEQAEAPTANPPLDDGSRPAAPATGRPLLGGLAIGLVMLLVAVGLAISGHSADPGTVSATGDTQTVAVRLIEMDIVPGEITVTPGTRLVLEVTNQGGMRHDLAFPDGPATRMLAPGETQRLDLGTQTTSRTGWCTVAGHKAAGMSLTVSVAGAAPPGAAAAGSAATIAPGATPDPGFRAADATLPPVENQRVHRVTLRVTDQTLAVAPGVTQRMWTFGGTVPGPVLHGRVGDTFVVTLVNDASMGHSIDFHAGMLAPDVPMRTIEAGEQLVYQFTATHAGAWMYHCATAPMTQHIGNGMYGAVVIDPPDLRPVSAEYVLVQSELYLGQQGQPGDFAKMAAGTPDAVVFNGYYDQYRHAPLSARAGERVRIWIVDAGLERPSAFHVVGTQFDTVFSEGAYLVQPGDPAHGAAQALALQPGQGGFVEFIVPEPGRYPLLSHLMVDAHRGASGVIAATR
jgi:nitrite reductase (NO-forming)